MHDEINKPEKVPAEQGPLEMEGAHESIAFLLSRVGSSVSEQFGEAMAKHGLVPRQFLVLNIISQHEGESQQAVSESIGVAKSRMVGVIDELEEKGLVERRLNPYDRRQHALFLTKQGQKLRDQARATAQAHEARIRSVLSPEATGYVLEALQKLAELDDTPPGIHPALAKKFELGG